MTGHANQCHLESAVIHLPQQPCLVSHSACISQGGHWGAVIHLPSLPHGPSVEDCKYIETSINGNDTQMIHIRAHIYPPKPPNHSRVSNELTICVYNYLIKTLQCGVNDFILYRNALAEVEAFLEHFTLIQSYNDPSDLLLQDLISTIVNNLKNSEHNMSFMWGAWNRYIPSYEVPVMGLLSIIYQGKHRCHISSASTQYHTSHGS